MNEGKRKIGEYTVLCSVNVGEKEVILASNEQSTNGDKFMCGFAERNDLFELCSECMVSDDYIEIVHLFGSRVANEAELFKEQVEKLDIPITLITEADCIPDHYSKDINGKIIANDPKVLKPEFQRADRQLYYVTGGFGASANSRGSAVFCTNLHTGKSTRYERMDVMGEIKPERLPEWAKEKAQKFASQIMTSKSPVRSAEDIDETALSYAEIKMLATGNPYIKEKMDLDIQVQKLKLLKSNFLSEKYALEDKIIKYYPQRITALENRIEGLKQDVDTAKQHPKPTDDRFVGMEVKGVFYSEKADAGKAIINACKQMNSPDPIPLGKYRGFETELLFNTAERNYEVRLKGATSRNVPLGDDAHGNIIRLDNGIDRFAESLSLAENDLENTKNQLETAKKEVQKPFIQEEELKTKLARLDELNILLNMDKRDNEIVGGEPDEGEVPNTRKEKTYER